MQTIQKTENAASVIDVMLTRYALQAPRNSDLSQAELAVLDHDITPSSLDACHALAGPADVTQVLLDCNCMHKCLVASCGLKCRGVGPMYRPAGRWCIPDITCVASMKANDELKFEVIMAKT